MNFKARKKKISFEEVDRERLSDYAYLCAKKEPIDEVDFYRFFLFDADLMTKEQRLAKWNKLTVFDDLLEGYSMTDFGAVKLSMESIQMSRTLSGLFQQRKLARVFDAFLAEFYEGC